MSMNRREFCQTVASAGAAIAMADQTLAEGKAVTKKGHDDLNVALIGCGAEGNILRDACLRIPGIRFKAVCDIWEYARVSCKRALSKYDHVVNDYEFYKDMIDQEKDLDAVIVASPDWMHAEHANYAMTKGLDVYCEKEMSNSLVKARTMVETAKKTGKLLQIGHQRRSNPRYIHAIDTIIHDINLLGRVTHANAQWNRTVTKDLGWPMKHSIPASILSAKYGYDSMHQLRNWRWYKKYGGGPIVDLGSHQIDLFAWVFGCNPSSVVASGGVDYYDNHEWYDNVMCIYEYKNDAGIQRAFYQTLTTSSHGANAETFMGENGTLLISEVAARGNAVEREARAPKWDVIAKKGYLLPVPVKPKQAKSKNTIVDVRESPALPKWPLPVELAKYAHQPHLENFFDAIRFGKPLNCPAEIGYETAVAVLACNDAVASNKKINFKPGEFHA